MSYVFIFSTSTSSQGTSICHWYTNKICGACQGCALLFYVPSNLAYSVLPYHSGCHYYTGCHYHYGYHYYYGCHYYIGYHYHYGCQLLYWLPLLFLPSWLLDGAALAAAAVTDITKQNASKIPSIFFIFSILFTPRYLLFG